MTDRRVSVVGLGYVGLPVAVAFGRRGRVVGFDVDPGRVAELRAGRDRTGEVEPAELAAADIHFTDRVEDLRAADFHIVAVPTPVDEARRPDLSALLAASETVGRALKRGDIVVYESTVHPGATEEECAPVLERASGLRCGVDFHLGYSPERINPGDREHTFSKIRKVVSGQDAATLETVAAVYGPVVDAGLHRAPSIRVAEAAKAIENAQRDLNIAFMNELAMIFDRMGIDTLEVLEAAGTKWNFLPFRPGLVGGHCVGVDPYYLTAKAERLGYHPEVILAGRRINDQMGTWIAQQAVKLVGRNGSRQAGKGAAGTGAAGNGTAVTVLGLTFKEDCPDIRNTRVVDIVRELESFGLEVQVNDPLADPEEVRREYGIEVKPIEQLRPAAAVVVAVGHRAYRALGADGVAKLLEPGGVLLDVKGIFDRAAIGSAGVRLWRL